MSIAGKGLKEVQFPFCLQAVSIWIKACTHVFWVQVATASSTGRVPQQTHATHCSVTICRKEMQRCERTVSSSQTPTPATPIGCLAFVAMYASPCFQRLVPVALYASPCVRCVQLEICLSWSSLACPSSQVGHQCLLLSNLNIDSPKTWLLRKGVSVSRTSCHCNCHCAEQNMRVGMSMLRHSLVFSLHVVLLAF